MGGIRIDWNIIRRLAGGQRLEGHVPSPSFFNSGVQIATGFDLGRQSDSDLWELGLAPELVARLEPYCGRRANTAAVQLHTLPLKVSQEEADAIDRAYQQRLVGQLTTAYDEDSRAKGSSVLFTDLAAEAQTVIASVATLYGGHLREETSTFWDDVTRQDWGKAVEDLRNFGDPFGERHAAEADLLARIASGPVVLECEGRILDCPVRIDDGRAFVPVDCFAEQLGHRTEWDGRLKQLRVDGRLVDFPFVLDEDVAWAWVRDLAASAFFHLSVDWDGIDRVIHLHPQAVLQPQA